MVCGIAKQVKSTNAVTARERKAEKQGIRPAVVGSDPPAVMGNEKCIGRCLGNTHALAERIA